MQQAGKKKGRKRPFFGFLINLGWLAESSGSSCYRLADPGCCNIGLLMRKDVVDCFLDRRNFFRLFIGNFGLKLFLKSHDQLNRV